MPTLKNQKKAFTSDAPPQLTGEKARVTWKEITTLISAADDRLLSAIDRNLLMDYCEVTQQLFDIQGILTIIIDNFNQFQETIKDNGGGDGRLLKGLLSTSDSLLGKILKVDDSIHKKRVYLANLRKKLYLDQLGRADGREYFRE
jgi:hypothetical protein